MIRYKSNASQWSMTFATSTECDNNVTKHFITSTDGGKKRVCVKYHNSTTSYGLTTDTTASGYSPRIYINDTDCYFGSQYTIDTTSEMSANVNNTVVIEPPATTKYLSNISSTTYLLYFPFTSKTSIGKTLTTYTVYTLGTGTRSTITNSTTITYDLNNYNYFMTLNFENLINIENTSSSSSSHRMVENYYSFSLTYNYCQTNSCKAFLNNNILNLNLIGAEYKINAYNATKTYKISSSTSTGTHSTTKTTTTWNAPYTTTTNTTEYVYSSWYDTNYDIYTEFTNSTVAFNYKEVLTEPYITSYSYSKYTHTNSQYAVNFSDVTFPKPPIDFDSDLNNYTFIKSIHPKLTITRSTAVDLNMSITDSSTFTSIIDSKTCFCRYCSVLHPILSSYSPGTYFETSLQKLHLEFDSRLILRNIISFSLNQETSTIKNSIYNFNYTLSYTKNITYTTKYSERTAGRFNYDSSTTSAYTTTYTENKVYGQNNSTLSMYYLESEFITTNLNLLNMNRSFLCGTSTFYAGSYVTTNTGHDVYYSIVNILKDNIYEHNDIDFGTYTGKNYYHIKKYNLNKIYNSLYNFYNDNIFNISGSENTTFEGILRYYTCSSAYRTNVYSSSTNTYYQPIGGNASIISTSTAYTYNYYSSYYTATINESVSITRNNNVSNGTASYTSSDVNITYWIDNITVEPSNIHTWNINV